MVVSFFFFLKRFSGLGGGGGPPGGGAATTGGALAFALALSLFLVVSFLCFLKRFNGLGGGGGGPGGACENAWAETHKNAVINESFNRYFGLAGLPEPFLLRAIGEIALFVTDCLLALKLLK